MTKDDIRAYIASEFLADDDGELDDDLDLVESGIMDSLGLLRLVAFLEEGAGITVEADELDQERFRSVNAIAGLVCPSE